MTCATATQNTGRAE